MIHAYQVLPWKVVLPLFFALMSAVSFAIVAICEKRAKRGGFVSNRRRIDIAPKTSRAFIKGVGQS